jgi:hypothetical protein
LRAARGGLQQAASGLNSSVPAEIDGYLLRLLHAQPSQRPSTANEVRASLYRLRQALL